MIDIRATVCYVSRLKVRDPSCTVVHVRQADLDALRAQIGEPVEVINGMTVVVDEMALALPRK